MVSFIQSFLRLRCLWCIIFITVLFGISQKKKRAKKKTTHIITPICLRYTPIQLLTSFSRYDFSPLSPALSISLPSNPIRLFFLSLKQCIRSSDPCLALLAPSSKVQRLCVNRICEGDTRECRWPKTWTEGLWVKQWVWAVCSERCTGASTFAQGCGAGSDPVPRAWSCSQRQLSDQPWPTSLLCWRGGFIMFGEAWLSHKSAVWLIWVSVVMYILEFTCGKFLSKGLLRTIQALQYRYIL